MEQKSTSCNSKSCCVLLLVGLGVCLLANGSCLYFAQKKSVDAIYQEQAKLKKKQEELVHLLQNARGTLPQAARVDAIYQEQAELKKKQEELVHLLQSARGSLPQAARTIDAKEIFDRARAENNPQMARLLNSLAISRNPTCLEYYEFMVKLALKSGDAQTLSETKHVLELGLHQVGSSDLSSLMKMMAQMDDAMAKSEKDVVQTKPLEEEVAEAWDFIREASQRREALRLTQELEQFCTDAGEENEAMKARQHIAFLVSQIELEERLANCGNNNETLPQLLRCREIIAQQRHQNQDLLLPEVREQIEKNKAVLLEKYKPFLESFEEAEKLSLSLPPDGTEWNEITKKIQLQHQILNRQNQLVGYFPEELAKGFTERLKKREREIRELERRRYIDYQRWALSILRNTFTYKEHMSNNATLYTDDDAIQDAVQLAAVDLSLLSPESSSVYQDIVEKIKTELPGQEAAACMIFMATGQDLCENKRLKGKKVTKMGLDNYGK